MDFFFSFVMDLSLYCNCNLWRHYLSIWPFLKWWICLSSVFVFRGIICLSPDHLPVNISLLWWWLHNNKVDHRVFNDDHGFHHGDHHEEDEKAAIRQPWRVGVGGSPSLTLLVRPPPKQSSSLSWWWWWWWWWKCKDKQGQGLEGPRWSTERFDGS